MPASYAIFNSRSLFMKGRVRSQGDREPQRASSNSGPSAYTSDFGKAPADVLVFDGVTFALDPNISSGQALAFVENMVTTKVITAQIGDTLAGGKVTAITLDELDVNFNGRVSRIEIGHNLNGGVPDQPVYSSSPAPTTGPSRAVAGGGPGGGDGGSVPGGGPAVAPPPGSTETGASEDDILAKMRKRREAELNGATPP
jgi:hypothetical protein